MPELVSTPANIATAQAMYQAGATTREVASFLKVSPYSAWAFKQRETIDPTLIQHLSKSMSDKLLLAASSATDTILEKAMDGELAKEKPIELAKIASICLQSAGAYAAQSGQANTLGQLAAEFGIGTSHSVSRVTMEKMTVEVAQKSPVILQAEAQAVPCLEKSQADSEQAG